MSEHVPACLGTLVRDSRCWTLDLWWHHHDQSSEEWLQRTEQNFKILRIVTIKKNVSSPSQWSERWPQVLLPILDCEGRIPYLKLLACSLVVFRCSCVVCWHSVVCWRSFSLILCSSWLYLSIALSEFLLLNHFSNTGWSGGVRKLTPPLPSQVLVTLILLGWILNTKLLLCWMAMYLS